MTPAEPQPRKPGLLRRLVGRLPAPRDEALLEIGRGVRDVVLGREPLSVVSARRAAIAEERRRVERGQALLAAGDPSGALAAVEAIERIRPGSEAAAGLRIAAARAGQVRGGAADRPSATTEVLAAIDHLRRLGHAEPVVVLYHQASPKSPFQALLYRRAWERGVAPIPIWDLGDVDAVVAAVPAGTRLILHLHWVNGVLHGATGPEDIATRLATFTGRLDRAIAAGVQVVWTVHNVLPHDTPFEAADTELRRIIVERAVMVHVLAASTPELAAEHYLIPPEKVVHVPLPSFRGAYPDIVGRAAARFALGLQPDAFALLLLGGMRPHKGFDTLLEAFDLAAAQEPRLHLIVAGPPAPFPVIEAFLERAVDDPRITLHARWIPSDDMQLFFRAADVAILPYHRTLNSASLMTALAFDLPAIAPPVGGIAETIEPVLSVTFEPGNAQSLAAAILASRDLPPDEVRSAARRISEAHDAVALSDQFMTALLAATEPAGPARPAR